MDLGLKGKVALVCAASAGIGKAIAKELAAEGAHVSIFSRNVHDIEATAREIERVAGGRVLFNVCDLTQSQSIVDVVSKTEAELGSIDILVNNQGGPPPGGFEEISEEQVRAAICLNLESVFLLTRLCLPKMKQRKWGRILNILSITAKEPAPQMFLSNVLRPAVLGFAKTLAIETAPLGITVNSLLPSAVLTRRTQQLLERISEREAIGFQEALDRSSKSIPMGRIATPEEFAQLVVFLCSANASYITGVAIPVDGGSSRSLF